MYVLIIFLITHLVLLFVGLEHLIREALHLNQNYESINNMSPKPARRFTSIPTSIGGQGGRQGRGVGRGSVPDDEERDDIPLAQRKSSLLPLKK